MNFSKKFHCTKNNISIKGNESTERETVGFSSRKGVAFTFDAFFALLIVIAIVPIIILYSSAPETASPAVGIQAESSIDTLAELKIRNVIREPAVSELYSRGVITDNDLDKSVMDVIVEMWASNSSANFTIAQNVTEKLLRDMLPENFRWSLSLEKDTLFDTGGTVKKTSATGRRIASGFLKGNQSSGFIASVFLTSIGGKKASSYYFFGGFVGQGNISFDIALPLDANITSIDMEMDIGTDFKLLINGNLCGTFNKTAAALSSDNWTVISTSCLGVVLKGANNTFEFQFLGNESTKHYIGGGFFKITYTTKQILLVTGNATLRYLPGISGAINYYDSLYISGNLTAMRVHLEFLSTYPLSMFVGNVTVYNFTGSSNRQAVDIPDPNISAMINYSKLSKKNVPIRLGAVKQVEGLGLGGNADIILVTSVSASMGMCDIRNGSLMSCGANGNVTRFASAKAADIEFAKTILNVTSNRAGNIGYHNNAPTGGGTLVELTSNLTAVINGINNFNLLGQSQRCYACAIDEARRRLIPSNASLPSGALPPTGSGSSYNKNRFIMLMSDGNSNFCDDEDEAVGEYNQNCGAANSKKQAIDQACLTGSHPAYSTNSSKLVIHTVAFGTDIDNSTLIAIANCTGGRFFQSNNYSDIVNIYRNISQGIVSISFAQQVINVSGAAESMLYRNSYIEYNYEKEEPAAGFQEIQVDQETGRFASCTGSFFIPSQLKVVDSRVTSYSSNFWTSFITLGNSSVFNLSDFGDDYLILGDPFSVQIPPQFIVNATNNITIRIAENASLLSSNCSASNRLIYSARFKASVPSGNVFPELKGGIARVYYDIDHDGASDGFTDVVVGGDLPNFNSTIRTTDQMIGTANALDDAFVRLMNVLNFVVVPGNSGVPGAQTNPIDIKLSDVNFDATGTGGIPFAWGPIDIRLDVKV